jgi:glycosyltransferase involved in cell wall biosynthesis
MVFAGYLEEKRLRCAYALGGMFVLPSRCELQGIAALEAMAWGCALLVGDDPESASRDLVEPGKNGYLISLGDPGDAAERIAYLAGHEEVLRGFGARSRLLARNHGLQDSLAQLEALYRELVGRRSVTGYRG